MPEHNLFFKMLSTFNTKDILSSILLGALFVLCIDVHGQADSTKHSKKSETPIIIDNNIAVDTAKRERHHYPRIATLSSALVPGLGQIYNQKYWKVPIIWGGGLALFAYFDYSNEYYHRFKLAYEQKSNELPVTDPDFEDMEQTVLNINKNSFRAHRDKALLYIGLLYAANIIDAMVDANMFDYDISDDLTLHWEPTLSPPDARINSATTYGINVQFRF
jgi:hypothetical protein